MVSTHPIQRLSSSVGPDADVERDLIICFEPDAPADVVQGVLHELGFTDGFDAKCRWHDPGMLLVHGQKTPRPELIASLERRPGVRRVTFRDVGGLLVQKDRGSSCAEVRISDRAVIGGPDPVVIAGPCSVESESQLLEIAHCVREAGAHGLRGGAFKPRTSPYAFGGLSERGLQILARAREETGLPVVTEVLDPDQLDVVAEYADVFQIGSRNMHNYPLLYRVGSHPSGKPVLLKRGFGATIDEFVLAAEYVSLGRIHLGRTDPGLVLCERGIRTFETASRFTLDVAAIPILKERTRLPIVADPSHPAGQRRYVPALARAAVAAGADGLLIEVHVTPDAAWSDGQQSLEPEAFRTLMRQMNTLAELARADAADNAYPRPELA